MARKSKQSKPKSTTKSKRGGKRQGAGRKPSSAKTIEKRVGITKADVTEEADQVLREYLPRSLQNLMLLASGGYERVELEYTAAPIPEIEGISVEPDLVLTKRKVSVAEPDRAANIYLVDRVMGKPRQSVEVDTRLSITPDVMARADEIRKKRAESGGS